MLRQPLAVTVVDRLWVPVAFPTIGDLADRDRCVRCGRPAYLQQLLEPHPHHLRRAPARPGGLSEIEELMLSPHRGWQQHGDHGRLSTPAATAAQLSYTHTTSSPNRPRRTTYRLPYSACPPSDRVDDRGEARHAELESNGHLGPGGSLPVKRLVDTATLDPAKHLVTRVDGPLGVERALRSGGDVARRRCSWRGARRADPGEGASACYLGPCERCRDTHSREGTDGSRSRSLVESQG